MWHKTRHWGVSTHEDLDELAVQLAENTYTLCSAFKTNAGTVWVNDSLSEDAAQEYGVLRKQGDAWHQVETITVSWSNAAKVRAYIDQANAGHFDDQNLGTVNDRQLEIEHARCELCG